MTVRQLMSRWRTRIAARLNRGGRDVAAQEEPIIVRELHPVCYGEFIPFDYKPIEFFPTTSSAESVSQDQ